MSSLAKGARRNPNPGERHVQGLEEDLSGSGHPLHVGAGTARYQHRLRSAGGRAVSGVLHPGGGDGAGAALGAAHGGRGERGEARRHLWQ